EALVDRVKIVIDAHQGRTVRRLCRYLQITPQLTVEQLEKDGATCFVQPLERFIEKYDVRFRGHTLGDCQALAFAAADLLAVSTLQEVRAKPELRQQIPGILFTC